MAIESRYQMSQQRLDDLKKELDYLTTVREKEVAEQIKEARSFGDLSENSEYDEAKTEQGKLYSRIAEVNDLIENAEIIEVVFAEGTVAHGTKVTLLDVEFGEQEVYTIVGGQEADPINGKISGDSPIGRGVLGRKAGESFVVETPDGPVEFRVISMEN